MGRAERLTKELKKYDRKLYVDKSIEGKLCVYRHSTRLEHYDLDGVLLTVARPTPFLIFPLTHNFRHNGHEVEWGVLPIRARLDAIDAQKRDIARELEIQEEKHLAATERDRLNHNEAFLKDFRPQFAKVFSDVNTSSLAKRDRRKIDEEKLKCQSLIEI